MLREWKISLFKRHTIEPRELIEAVWQFPVMEPASLSSSPAEEGALGQAAPASYKDPSYVIEGLRVSGELCFEGSGRIDGEFEGKITSTARVIIGEKAKVTAKIKAASVVVAGRFSGEIAVSDSVEIRPSARVSAYLIQGAPSQGLDVRRVSRAAPRASCSHPPVGRARHQHEPLSPF